MPLTDLKPGHIRASAITRGAGNYQVKIGGRTYWAMIKARRASHKKREPTAEQKRRTEIYGQVIPSFYNNKTFNDLNRLMKLKHTFNEEQKQIVVDILRESTGENKFIKIELENGNIKNIPLNNKTINSLEDALTNGYFGLNAYNTGSDAVNEVLTLGIKNIELGTLSKKSIFQKSGNFFRYINKTEINLERYQIISKKSNIKILDEHCLIYTLQQYKINNELLNRIKTTFEAGSFFPKKNLIIVCDIIKKNINLTWYDKNGTRRNQKYGKVYNETLDIALYLEHYFINEKTKYSHYSSKNYNEIKNKKDFHDIFRKDNGKYVRDKKLKTDSITLIRNLYDSDHFEKDNHLIKSHDKYQRNKDKIETLELIEEEQTLYEFKPKNNDKKTIIFYADIETDVHGDTHKPLLMRFTKTGDRLKHGYTYERKRTDTDNKLYTRFMDSLCRQSKSYEKVVVYFHNLKYDYNILKKLLCHIGAPCEKDGQLYNVVFRYKGRMYEFRDSYKLAPMPLSAFQSSFGLPRELTKKEAIAYEYYTVDNMENNIEYVDVYEKYLTEENKKIFKNNLEENKGFRYRKDETGRYIFDPNLYYQYYLEYDTYILKEGLEKFEKIIEDIVAGLNEKYKTNHKIKLFDYLTISSLTHSIMGAFGVYDDVYQMCGNLREFCGNFVTGGRVQVNENYKKKIINEKIADYDGVSLYPSAIKRLCEEKGLPKGKAKRITFKEKKLLDKFEYYMVKIEITKINKHQQLPMVSYKDDEGLLQYINEIPKGKKSIVAYVDKITLGDWIEYQDIDYDIIDGVYYNGGNNKRMGEIIYYLFTNRLKHKKEGNQAMQLILKLMMNSSYGKTITKKTMTKKAIVNNNNKEQYIANYFNTVKEWTKLNDFQWEVKIDSVDTSYNMCNVGSLILSYSKRIMNEVFDIANDHKCALYYTDTDSIHCNYDDVKIIEEEFKKKYKRDLTGKNLGQFHIDFDLKNAKSEIYATKSIFLGKKCYIDKLESTNEKGEIINGYHFRMKGVNTQGIMHCVNKKFEGDIFELYKYLSKGKKQDIVLNPQGGKPSFEYDTQGVHTRETGEFVRTVQF